MKKKIAIFERGNRRAALLAAAVTLIIGLHFSLQAQIFNSHGKRDPFIDLTQALREEQPVFYTPPALSQRPPGLPGLLVTEVTVTGLAVGEESKIAILRGVDDFTYLAREGSKLFDGHVSEISRDTVVFIQKVFDPRGGEETKKTVKRLYTEEN